MTLTPEAVRNKQFTPTRFRPGYDEDEVDRFLDEVETELTRLLTENSELGARLEAAPATAPPARVQPAPAPPAPPPPPPAEDPGSVALRTLQLAQRTAEEAVAQARAEAESIVGEARQRSSRLDEESQRQRLNVISELDRQRARLEAEVEELRAFEQEYRSRLQAYLESQLRALQGQDDVAPDPASVRGSGADGADDDEADVLAEGIEVDPTGRHAAGGRHRLAPPADEEPLAPASADGQGADGQPPVGQGDGQPPVGQGFDGQPAEGRSADGQPPVGQSADGQPADIDVDEGPEPTSS